MPSDDRPSVSYTRSPLAVLNRRPHTVPFCRFVATGCPVASRLMRAPFGSGAEGTTRRPQRSYAAVAARMYPSSPGPERWRAAGPLLCLSIVVLSAERAVRLGRFPIALASCVGDSPQVQAVRRRLIARPQSVASAPPRRARRRSAAAAADRHQAGSRRARHGDRAPTPPTRRTAARPRQASIRSGGAATGARRAARLRSGARARAGRPGPSAGRSYATAPTNRLLHRLARAMQRRNRLANRDCDVQRQLRPQLRQPPEHARQLRRASRTPAKTPPRPRAPDRRRSPQARAPTTAGATAGTLAARA